MSGKLSLGLSERLGDEVASDLINEFNAMETAQQSEFHALRQDVARLETRLVEFKAELKQDVAGLRSELIKWTFVFWLGTIGIVMMLLRYFSETG